jgi:hypothetical protein
MELFEHANKGRRTKAELRGPNPQKLDMEVSASHSSFVVGEHQDLWRSRHERPALPNVSIALYTAVSNDIHRRLHHA